MKRIKTLAIILLFTLSTWSNYGQTLEFKDFKYSSTEYVLDEKYANEEEVILERNIKSEYVFNDDSAIEFYLFHEKTLINSDNAIERNNKVYLPSKINDVLIVNKLRVILKNGKIIELKASDIKEEVDQQTNMRYKYFAVNGLEKGAVIERYYILKKKPEVTGQSIIMQNSVPVLKTTLELIYPNHLVFSTASYNGFPKAENIKDRYENKNAIYVEASNIPPLPMDESQSNLIKNVQKISYKLDQNIITNHRNMYGHSDYAKDFFEVYNTEISKSESRAIDAFVKNIEKSDDEKTQIQNIETYIKQNIQYNYYFNGNETIADLIKSKQGNLFDILRLNTQIFKRFNIPYELVLTTERFSNVFDPNFESLLNFKDALFYFPNVDIYVEPAATIFRTPMFDPQFAGNYGLFIKGKLFNGVEVPVAEVRLIDFPKNQSLSVMDIHVDFANEITEPYLTSKIEFNGYESLNFQPAKDFSNPEEYNEMLQTIAKNYTAESEIISTKAFNEGLENVGKKPYIIEINANAKDLLTKAGPNYIFKVGEVIGSQMEMYEEKKRILPIEIENPHSYKRTITLNLPEGYTIKNPEIFNMNYELKHEGKVVADFISTYEVKGNQVIVKNTENYDFVELPSQLYPQYQKVINAAADFNKLSIILEKI